MLYKNDYLYDLKKWYYFFFNNVKILFQYVVKLDLWVAKLTLIYID